VTLIAACNTFFAECDIGESMKRSIRLTLALSASAVAAAAAWRHFVMAAPPSDLTPLFDGTDAARPHVAVSLVPIVTGLSQPTDVQFPPGRDDLMLVLEKGGTIRAVTVADGRATPWLEVSVRTAGEEGLLGLAFHPRFAENGRFFLDLVTTEDGQDVTHVEEWTVKPGGDLRAAKPERKRVLLVQPQPYTNHNAGQLQFGPDGKLYVGLGDGGSANDPHGNGQNPGVLLGKMLRLDVDGPSLVPSDNPFVGREGWRPEIWAYGLRNPWRYAFSPDGRLVVADVGQNLWEEIDVVGRGDNLGWARREGRHCFPPDTKCSSEGMVDPIHEYGRDEGLSITGGVFVTGDAVPALRGKYLFADFGSGRFWAIDVPKGVQKVDTVQSLGRWPVTPTAFGRDAKGDAYVADFARGIVYKLAKP
jgi:glucose/arabinose dehydrogenase